MKKIFLLALCTVFAVSTFAQTNDEVPAKKPSVKGFVSNGFWDNWEISVGFGTATERIGKDDHGSFWHSLGWEANGSLTKWLHPVFGVRGQLQVGKFKDWKEVYSEDPVRTPFIFAHADLMVNLSNWIGGYREDRVYYAVPFAGFGYQGLNFTGDCNSELAFTAGLLNKFRVCKCIDINLELKGWAFAESGHTLDRGGKAVTAWSATAGISYRFNKRNFARESVKVCENTDAAAYAALIAEKDAALAAAAAEAEALRAAANKPAVERVVEKTKNVYVGGKMVTFFGIGKSTLSEQEKIRLDLKANQIKNGPADKVYNIEGHADSQTGSAAVNQAISEKRAKAVYDYLVSQGVKPEQLTYKGSGDKAEPFSSVENNRVAIID